MLDPQPVLALDAASAAASVVEALLPVARPVRRQRVSPSTAPPVLVEVRRGATIESRHRGHVVHVAADGSVIRAAGTPGVAVMLRSTVKPLALVALVESGAADDLALTPAELAVMCGSHGGEDRHVRTAPGTPETSQCQPVDPALWYRWCSRRRPHGRPTHPRRRGAQPHPAGLLRLPHRQPAAFRVLRLVAGWLHGSEPPEPAGRARDGDPPPGRRSAALRTGLDDCGLLTYEVTLVDLARAYLLLADPDGSAPDAARARSAPALRRIRDAMMAAPEMVGGSADNLDTELMRRRPGRLVAKAGADGLRAVGLLPRPATRSAAGDGPLPAAALAIKIEDGDHSRRAITAASVEALAQIGALDERDLRALAPFRHPVAHAPDGSESAEAAPCFELAPLRELVRGR